MSRGNLTLPEALAKAVEHHRAGRLDSAERIYRRILDAQPRHAASWNLLGMVHLQRGQLQDALEHAARAVGLDPTVAKFHANLGLVHKASGRLDEAVACYRRALELKPDDASALNDLGTVLQDQERPDEALDCYRRATELNPEIAEARHNLGNLLEQQGKLEEAVACYRRAATLNPALAETHTNLGRVLQRLGKLDDAVDVLRTAVALEPRSAAAFNNLGAALHDQRKLVEAAECYRRAIELAPGFSAAHNNLATLLQDQGQLDEAIDSYRLALQLDPNSAEAHYNLGEPLQIQGKLDEAIASYRQALAVRSDYLVALGALVHEMQHVCLWDGLEDLSRRAVELVEARATDSETDPLSPFSFVTLPTGTTAQQQLHCAQQWASQRLPVSTPRERSAPTVQAGATSKLVIGYLSADFRTHATASLVAELFERHDRSRFEIFGYSYSGQDNSPIRSRLEKAFDRFVDITDLSLAEAARRIAADGVQILVDLKGYTKGARSQILALRPAPIQVNYLGYPGTMGSPALDYILVDNFIVPSDQQPWFTEKLVHLPHCYQVNDSQRPIAQHTPSRQECELPAEGFVFASFNSSYKITPAVFDVWMRLLEAVDGSVLWLLATNRFVADNLRREAQARGVAAERLVFAPRLPSAEHLARHRLVDLFLDTLPVNAHTTASDALWAGCPLVTIAGQTFVSRVAGSVLRCAGLEDLIAWNLNEYEAIALRLATDPGYLAEVRARVEAARTQSPLFDAARFARNLERAFTTMWECHVAGSEPRAFRVEAERS
jgi:protein O-GlcNAc transferase